MDTRIHKAKSQNLQKTTRNTTPKNTDIPATSEFIDNRSQTAMQKTLQKIADNSPQSLQLKQRQQIVGNGAQVGSSIYNTSLPGNCNSNKTVQLKTYTSSCQGRIKPPLQMKNGTNINKTIQLLEAKNADIGHNGNPIRSNVHQVTETVTNQMGDGSDTGNFSHANGSEFLDKCKVHFGGLHIGDVVTKGGDGNTIVKMHMVNSYLHPNANNWNQNWTYGAKQLNTEHTGIEKTAKSAHPEKKPANTSLNYETQASSGDRPDINDSKNVKTDILSKLKYHMGLLYGKHPNDSAFEIGGKDIKSFQSSWEKGVSNCATEKVIVRYRVSTGETWGATTTNTINNSNPGAGYYLAFSPKTGLGSDKDLIRTYLDNGGAFPPTKKRTRKRRILFNSGGSPTKKHKPGKSK